ncbi:MAG: VWA domain-containing protein [Acidobacteria bacterium]|nr:VWA domain-containing protein [Acidobacteriota bacterium]
MLFKKSRTFLIGCAAAFIFAASAAAQTPTPTPVIDDTPETVFTEEIKLNVSAFDTYGDFVSEVGVNDLVILEDGRIHQASSIRRLPASVLIVLDTGGEMRTVKSIGQTRSTAKALVSTLKDEDSLALIEYNDTPKILSEWTTDKSETMRALDKDLNFGRRSAFVDALQLATEFLSKSENENRHLVLITDGTDSFDRVNRRAEEMRRLMTTNINVHVISYTQLEAANVEPKTKGTGVKPHPNPLPDEVIAGLPNGVRETAKATKIMTINTDKEFLRVMRKRMQDLEDSGKFLLELSENTSGMYILPETKEEMTEKAKLIGKIIDSNYVVTYTPKRPLSESPDGEVRTVEVSSRRPGLRVSAKRKILVENEVN